jgi:uncharacterized cupin superfamily protein
MVRTAIREARLESTQHGSAPAGDGWFVLNAREARWMDGVFGAYTRFEAEPRFPSLGINVGVLQPGQPSSIYHRENEQEDFLVLSGECLLLVEGQERRLQAWDFVHCPAWTEHVFVGAGDGPCVLLAVGTRLTDEVVYPESSLALRHGAGVQRESRDPDEAYAHLPDDEETRYREGWLPG